LLQLPFCHSSTPEDHHCEPSPLSKLEERTPLSRARLDPLLSFILQDSCIADTTHLLEYPLPSTHMGR
jgi:hypothetical protein